MRIFEKRTDTLQTPALPPPAPEQVDTEINADDVLSKPLRVWSASTLEELRSAASKTHPQRSMSRASEEIVEELESVETHLPSHRHAPVTLHTKQWVPFDRAQKVVHSIRLLPVDRLSGSRTLLGGSSRSNLSSGRRCSGTRVRQVESCRGLRSVTISLTPTPAAQSSCSSEHPGRGGRRELPWVGTKLVRGKDAAAMADSDAPRSG